MPIAMGVAEIQTELAGRLRARQGEIGQTALTRVEAISDPAGIGDEEYREGLKAAVATALEHGIAAIETCGGRPQPIPTTLLSQARLAARNRVSLETVLRRYFAGYSLLGDFVIVEAERGDLVRGATLQKLLRLQASLFDRVVAAVSEEYAREGQSRVHSPRRLRAERVRRLLAGEPVDLAGDEIAYDFDGWHIGVVASGLETDALRSGAAGLDCRLLAVDGEKGRVWAWLGCRRRMGVDDVRKVRSQDFPAHTHMAIGEPAKGLAGWRRTHRQAAAALAVALQSSERSAYYGEVALEATVLKDELISDLFRASYLAPLEAGRDGGRIARDTLHAYFAAGRNVSSAASSLGVSRQTVASRLRTIEDQLEKTLDDCAVELELALRWKALT